MKKVYIIKKIVVANSIREALTKDKETPVDECWQSSESESAFINNLITEGKYERSLTDEDEE